MSAPRDLTQHLERAVSSSGDAVAALHALATLAPSDAAAWLLLAEAEARAACPPRDLERVLDTILAGAATGPVLAAAGDLLLRYADVASPQSAVAYAAALPDDARAGARDVLDAILKRFPLDARLLRAAADLAVRAGDAARADLLLGRLARADDSQATVRHVWRTRGTLVAPARPPVRLALLSSYTIDPLVPYLDAEIRTLGLAPSIYVSPFNSWAQDVVADDSPLARFDPEIAFLAVGLDDLIPDLAGAPRAEQLEDAARAALTRVVAIARRFTERASGLIVVFGFQSAYADPFGPMAGRKGAPPARAQWIASLNAQLALQLAELERAYFLDLSDVVMRRAHGAFDNPKLRHLASMRLGDGLLDDVARACARFVAPAKGLTRKCVVLDLDNTLWGGVVGEDGAQGIKLGDTSPGSEYREFQRYLLTLADRGILLAINSKNNPDDALEVLREHEGMLLREAAFSAQRINWLPKPDNMVSIAQELGIGLDALVFVDDNPDEREMMRQVLPQVLTVNLPADPARYRQALESLPQLQTLTATAEDAARVDLYRSRREREGLKEATGSLDDYLRSLEIVAEIEPASESALPRVQQLFQRTNQFNLTTRRYDQGALAGFARDPGWQLYTLRARDRFGDHGLVATALVRTGAGEWVIDSFLMSCRVIGYGLETALLARVCADARAAGVSRVIGEYIETRKNVPARDFYTRHGFAPLAAPNGDGVLRLGRTLDGTGVEHPGWVALGTGA